MTSASEEAPPADRPSSGRLGLTLTGAAVLCLVAAGALLWWQQGDAVFAGLVSSALAWCF